MGVGSKKASLLLSMSTASASLIAISGRPLALINGDETIEGIIRGVDGLGRLLVENDVGVVVPMSSGEVHVTSFQG